jgi:DNA transformation protein
MPVTEAAVQSLLAPLSAVRPITSRKMFGGIGIYCDGVFFAVIDDDRLYFKVGEGNLADYEALSAAQWTIDGPNGGPMPYREVPIEILNAPDILGGWVDKAVRVALSKKKKK